MFVTDQQGRPVTDLTADDFQLDEDGVAQTVTSFSLVNVPVKSAAAPAASIDAEPDVQSNLKPDGRLYVFAMDGLGGEYALRTRLFLRRFLEEHFTENDTAALVYLGPSQARNTQDFTGNTRLLLRSINNIMGGSSITPAPAESAMGSSTLAAATTKFSGRASSDAWKVFAPSPNRWRRSAADER